MSKIKLTISITIFSLLLGFTSLIKNETRIIEKKILKIERKILLTQKDLYESELDYSYLSTPNNLSKKIQMMEIINYEPMHFSRIYLNYNDFINSSKKITKIKFINEKEKEKK